MEQSEVEGAVKIVVTRRVDLQALEPLTGHEIMMWPDITAMPTERLGEVIGEAEGILTSLTDHIDEELLAGAPLLRVVSQVAAGVDNIDLESCTRRGIPVGHTPDVLTETTADTAFALLAAVVRRLPEGRDHVHRGQWGEWRPDVLLGGDLHGSTLGVIGLGRIGAAVARRCGGFGMRVLYSGRSRHPHLEVELRASYRSLPALLAESDHVVVTAALTDLTRGLIDAEALAMMKPTATLVNVARGQIVDTGALVDALASGVIGGAALDVTEPEPLPAGHPLLALPNCLVIPHLGSASVKTRGAMLDLAVDNLVAGLGRRVMPACANPAAYGQLG